MCKNYTALNLNNVHILHRKIGTKLSASMTYKYHCSFTVGSNCHIFTTYLNKRAQRKPLKARFVHSRIKRMGKNADSSEKAKMTEVGFKLELSCLKSGQRDLVSREVHKY